MIEFGLLPELALRGPWWRYWGSAKRRQVQHGPRASDGARRSVGALHKVLTVLLEWRATADEDGHYCFAVAL